MKKKSRKRLKKIIYVGVGAGKEENQKECTKYDGTHL
jgi:hypothetical protein